MIWKFFLFFVENSSELYPTYDAIIIEFSGTFGNVKFPSISEIVPISLFFTRMLAPIIGSPFLSLIFPLICIVF